jgi:uncharacterized protein
LPSGPEELVINTGPLVALGLAQATDVIGRLPLQFVAPAEVANEIAAGRKRGFEVAMPEWVCVVDLARPVGALDQSALDAGEAAVIELAIERSIRIVAIDEVRGRRAATAAGLTVTGSLGLLGLAKTHGLIPRVAPYVARMRTSGVYLDDTLVNRFLDALGESAF